jgi:hypothetical protein
MQMKRPSSSDGLKTDGGEYHQATQPKQAGSLSNKLDQDTTGCQSYNVFDTYCAHIH